MRVHFNIDMTFSGVFRNTERGATKVCGTNSLSGVQGRSPGRGSGERSLPEAGAFKKKLILICILKFN
jgi:hypothetical protein